MLKKIIIASLLALLFLVSKKYFFKGTISSPLNSAHNIENSPSEAINKIDEKLLLKTTNKEDPVKVAKNIIDSDSMRDKVFTPTGEQKKIFYSKNINELIDKSSVGKYVSLAEETLKALSVCLSDGTLCNQQPDLREGGVEYQDPSNTIYHFYVDRSLQLLQKAAKEDVSASRGINYELVSSALKIQHSTIPLRATEIILENKEASIDMREILKSTKALMGPVKAQIYVTLAHSDIRNARNNADFVGEITSNITLNEDPTTSRHVFDKLYQLKLSAGQFESTVRKSCHLKNNLKESSRKDQFNRSLQFQLAKMNISQAPAYYCP